MVKLTRLNDKYRHEGRFIYDKMTGNGKGICSDEAVYVRDFQNGSIKTRQGNSQLEE